MRALVTGAAGFIGSHLARHLLDEGHDVVGVDDFAPTYDPALKRRRLAELRAAHPTFAFHELDLADRAAAAPLLAQRYDHVFHLGARAGVRQSLLDPWSYLRANAEATLNVLEGMRRGGTTRMLLASTSSLYGDRNPRPFREDANTDRPLSPYAASKKAAEAMAASYVHLYGLHVSVCRFFTVYGPAGRPDMSVFRFVERISRGAPIVLMGDGSQERDFTYVDDIVRGARAAAERADGFEVYNLGNDAPTRLLDLVALIEKEVGAAARIDRRPAAAADVSATHADITKARQRLGWSPRVPLEEGIRRTVAWHRANASWLGGVDLGDG